MRSVVAFGLSVSLFLGACFPNNAKHRMYAKIGEGGALVGGIVMLAVVNSGADCDASSMPGGEPDEGCKTKAAWLGNVGLGLILIGLLGFIATVSTSEDDTANTAPVIVPKTDDGKQPEDKPVPATGTGAGSGSAAQ